MKFASITHLVPALPDGTLCSPQRKSTPLGGSVLGRKQCIMYVCIQKWPLLIGPSPYYTNLKRTCVTAEDYYGVVHDVELRELGDCLGDAKVHGRDHGCKEQLGWF